ncbi:unnamed protein product [Allacma fusca]|uniref:Uncharacterized protein n=1 Tax=Allacma fusca TaxID=39272 RepID=A0A8J2PQG7_9HEXA|nr:unnamed protein product [Allacma fusca]
MQGNCTFYKSCWNCLQDNCTWLRYSGKVNFAECHNPSENVPGIIGSTIITFVKNLNSCKHYTAGEIPGANQMDSVGKMLISARHNREREAYLQESMMVIGAVLLILILLLLAGLLYCIFQALYNDRLVGSTQPIFFKLLLMRKEDRQPIVSSEAKSTNDMI